MSTARTLTPRTGRVHGLSSSTVGVSVALGAAFWFIAAMVVHFGAPAGLYSGWAKAILFVVTPAVTWVTVMILRNAARASESDLVAAVSIATAFATMLDAGAMTFTPTLYASTPEGVLGGAIWILWGVGWGLTQSFVGGGKG
jgi:hypothetical protein